MPERKSTSSHPDELTSAGVRWSDVDDDVLPYVEWMDGRHGAAKDELPSVDEVPIPPILFTIPVLSPDRPTGTKPMIDVAGARRRLEGCRPGAWVVSVFTGWRWAKWPNGEVGWLPRDVQLSNVLRISSRDDAAK